MVMGEDTIEVTKRTPTISSPTCQNADEPIHAPSNPTRIVLYMPPGTESVTISDDKVQAMAIDK